MPECACCASLTLRELYKNAQQHGNGDCWDSFNGFTLTYRFPETAYFRHHQSWKALEQSARDGCRLCSTIYGEFTNVDHQNLETIEERLSNDSSTDIRIALDTLLRNDGSGSRLDGFIVQVGGNDYASLSDDRVYNDPDPRIAFRLNRPKDASENLCELDIGRPELETDLGSEQMFNIARSWVHQCTSGHVPSVPGCPRRRCEKFERTNLPTRVLDIGSGANTLIRLLITDVHRDYYVALSHCWGGGSSIMLTQENLESFAQDIPLEKAPRNFLDAISISRSLGFRYLWIDVLCIIQNSSVDWEIESARMSGIYKNAALTISASASPSTNAGILNEYVPISSADIEPHVRLKLDQGSVGQIYLSRRVPHEETFDDCFISLPLSLRGWALQEQILSRRNLYYGNRAIYWACRSSHQSADGTPAGITFESYLPMQIPPLFTVSSMHPKPDRRTVLSCWLSIVETYQKRCLTQWTDKLAAISGLASEIHQLIGGRYLSGIWFADLFNGMLWYPTSPEFEPNTSYRGPSWSWVGLDVETNFCTQDMIRVPSSHDAEVVHVETIAAGENVFGTVLSGFAKLRALTLEMDQSKSQYYRPDWGESNTLGDYLWKEKGQSSNFVFLDDGTFYHPGRIDDNVQTLDVPGDDSSIEARQCLVLYLGIWANAADGALTFIHLVDIGLQRLECQHYAYALLLRPSPSNIEPTYKRVGILRFDIIESPFFNGNTWKPRTVTIV